MWHGLTTKWPAGLDHRVPGHVQNIRQNHKFHPKCHRKQESGFDRLNDKRNRGKN